MMVSLITFITDEFALQLFSVVDVEVFPEAFPAVYSGGEDVLLLAFRTRR